MAQATEQNGLDWAVVGGKPNVNGHVLVILIIEDSLQDLEALSMHPYYYYAPKSIKTTVLQINLHHIRVPRATLCQKILADDLGVAVIQDTWTLNGRIMGMSTARGKLIYDTDCNKPRDCIHVGKRLKF